MSAGASGEAMDLATHIASAGYRIGTTGSDERLTDLALSIDALVQRAVERERERCCRAVCKHCAEGNEPRPARDYDQPMHLFQGYPPRVCSAAALRATSNTGG